MRRVFRVTGLLALLGMLMLSLTGCLRIHAAIAVSPDDLVSGELVVAALPVSEQDTGPPLTIPPELSDRVRTEKYAQDGYVGQKVTFSGLRFADVQTLVDTISEADEFRLSLRRAGGLVTLAGSVDLSQMPKDRADVQIKVAFPGSITRTNGDEDEGTISWSPKPAAITEFNAIAQYSDTRGESLTKWVTIVGGGALGASVIAALLALIAHRRSLSAERAQARR
ncbi:LppM family (lipo)protein [Actinophytocola sp. NPDC049390]|uniref:LppM family (lipo)protein n=1 Tax=Actinophytocola sp. NPDC049390 TaxID=3363894 RepID=UPI0037A5D890